MSIINQNQITDAETPDSSWKSLSQVGGIAVIIMFILIPIQSFIFIASPPPTTVIDYFALFQKNWLLGLLDLDLLYLVDNVLMIPIYLALYFTLKPINKSSLTIALTLSLVGLATYFASNPSFEMLSLSNQYAAATSDPERLMFLAAGQSMLAVYQGTAFNVYYLFNAIALLVFSKVMLQSTIFSKATAYLGILAGILMLVPSSAGLIGIYFSMSSLVPWTIWLILFARRLFEIERIKK